MNDRPDRLVNGNMQYAQQGNRFYYPPSGPPVNPFQYYQKPTLPYVQDTHMQPGFSQQKQSQPLLQYFQTEDGEMDMEKVMYTVNQLASTYHQVSPIFKNVGSLLKKIQK